MGVAITLAVVGAATTHGDIKNFVVWLQFLAGEREESCRVLREQTAVRHYCSLKTVTQNMSLDYPLL